MGTAVALVRLAVQHAQYGWRLSCVNFRPQYQRRTAMNSTTSDACDMAVLDTITKAVGPLSMELMVRIHLPAITSLSSVHMFRDTHNLNTIKTKNSLSS